MSQPPAFFARQPSGLQVLIDLSAPGGFGDFTFRATTIATERTLYFDAYHTGEASIFLDVVHAMASGRPVTDVLDDIARIRRDVHDRTSDLTATTTSEHTFDPLLFRITDMLRRQPATTEYLTHAGTPGRLALQPSVDTLRFTIRKGSTSRPRDPYVAVPTEQLWHFAAGMIWRSYSDTHSDTHSAAPLLTRLSTAAYESALVAFEAAVSGSAPPSESRRG